MDSWIPWKDVGGDWGEWANRPSPWALGRLECSVNTTTVRYLLLRYPSDSRCCGSGAGALG